jgi:predicted Zn-dependent protease
MKKAILLLFLGVFLSGCAVNPSTGKRQFNLVSDKEEIKIGREANKSIQSEYGVYRNQNIQDYVARIGTDIANNSTRPGLEYHFTVLDSPEINAFALPGGYIYVTRGILAQMNSEAELAFVLGHEVGHVAAKHGAQRLSQSRGLGFVFLTAQVLAGTTDYANYSQIVEQVAGLAVTGYGRKNEFESDLLGVDYSLNANYNPEEGAKFLETLKRQELYQSSWLTQMHSSHPPTDERIKKADQKILKVMPDSPLIEQDLKIERDAYIKEIDGIFMGKSPATGTLEKQQYVNNQYQIEFTIPKRCKLQASIEDYLFKFKSRAKFNGRFYVDKKETSLQDYLNWQELTGFKINESTDEITSSGNTFKLLTLTKDHVTYQLMLINGPKYSYRFEFELTDNLEETKKTLKTLVQSVRFIDDESFNKRGGYHLLIHSCTDGETLERISERYFKDKKHHEEIAAFNNLPLAIPLKFGQKVKIPAH